MIPLPCYARVLKANQSSNQTTLTAVDEDEIIYVTNEDASGWYGGSRLSGDAVKVHRDNINPLQLPDLRPAELSFVASIADYESDVPSDISFGRFTVVVVSKEVDANWYEGTVVSENGKRLGKAGLFPRPFVASLDKAKVTRTEEPSNLSTAAVTGPIDMYDTPPGEIAGTEDTLNEKVVFRDKTKTQNTLLPAPIVGTSQNGRTTALYPKLDHSNGDGVLQQADARASLPSSSFSTAFGIQPRPLSTSPNNNIGMASVEFDFTGRQTDELSVCAGDSVSVVKVVNDDWALCFDPANNRSGIVPLSFLHIFENDDDDDLADDDLTIATVTSPREYMNTQTTTQQLPVIDASQLDSFFGFSSAGGASMMSRPLTTIGECGAMNMNMKSMAWGEVEKKNAPARPPPPKIGAVRLRAAAQTIKQAPSRPMSLPASVINAVQSGHNTQPVIGTENMKEKVAEELIASELQYLSDIGMWQAEVENSSSLSKQHRKLFTNGMPQLKELSRQLVGHLAQQQSNPPDKQCYGFAFMQLKDAFMKTFALHFRCVETISVLIETDARVQSALNQCVSEMRALGSNVFDIHTAVSRPIQRCLKYPLFISELIKNTPLSHTDHPKLLEAQKQMSALASKMNESKRRKELATKYQASEQETLSKRLSKLNMHTVRKKSNRFKYRLTSQIGITRMQRDPTFELSARSLEISERRVCRFLHAVHIYRNIVSSQTKRYVDNHTTAEALAYHSDAMNADIRAFCRKLLQHATDISLFLDSTVVQEAKKYMRLPVTRMIQKRYDKLIDFESARRSDKSADDVRVKQGDYEALNNQLKATLPKIIDKINNRTYALVDIVISKDEEFFAGVTKLRSELSPEISAYFILPYRHFVDPYECRLRSIIAVGRAASEYCSAQSQNQPNTPNNSEESPAVPKSRKRVQTVQERDALIRIMKGQGTESRLMTAIQRWPPDVVSSADEQLCVEKGDVVMVLNQGNMQQPWLCDNGVTKGYIAGSCLTSYCDRPQSKTTYQQQPPDAISMAQSNLPSPSRRDEAAKTDVSAVKGDNLIDLEENLLDLNSPQKMQQTPLVPSILDSAPSTLSFMQTQPPTVSPSNPFLNDIRESVPQSGAQSRDNAIRLDSSAAILDDLFQDANSPRFSVLAGNREGSPLNAAPLIPVRPGGSHSLPEKVPEKVRGSLPEKVREQTRTQPVIAPSVPQQQLYDAPVNSTPSKDCEFYKADFDFSGADKLQLSIIQGEKVRVVKRSDDQGNSAWWMVENEAAMLGYVPANYISPAV